MKTKSAANLINASWERVQKARQKGRPTSLDYIQTLCSDFFECHGDRSFRDDGAIVGGVGLIEGRAVTLIGHQKGRDVHENILRNFGMPHPEGYRKALRLMKQAEKFKRPIICFIDTPGAYCGLGAEERGQGEAIARNLIEMAGLTVPVISIIIGEGGSGGALALGVANRVYMLENAIYSVLSPEGFASILWKDAARAPEAAHLMKVTAQHLEAFKIVDGIIEEIGEETIDLVETGALMKRVILKAIEELIPYNEENLISDRASKFRTIGI